MSAVPERQMLHAETIGFTHPRTGKHIEFTAPVPEDMQSLLNMLRKVKDTGKNLQD
jgi:23S rRNA pseudouridine1911/1915/1917 synthase